MAEYNEDELFNEDNKPESNWFKFEKIGDRVGGVVVEMFDKPAKDQFPEQRCFALKQKDGSIINVGLKKTSEYLMGRTNQVRPGDTLGVEFKAEIPSKIKGNRPAKSLEVFVIKGADPVDEQPI